jgi:serine/threonine protein kinase
MPAAGRKSFALAIPRPKLPMADFTILAVLGRGCLGRVMLVQRKDTDERCAIKSVQKKKLFDGKCKHGILAERNILLFIKNPLNDAPLHGGDRA